MSAPIIVIGAGLAGLWAALKCSLKNPVTIITAAHLGQGAASAWAQGGIAAAFDDDDDPSKHFADTIKAGNGINNEKLVRILTENVPAEIEELSRLGIDFDRDEEKFLLSREAGHQYRRIVRSRGDMAGKTIMSGLTRTVLANNNIKIIENALVGRLALDDSQNVGGVFVWQNNSWELLPASAVVLATGGVGQLYKTTTNPPQALGFGIAMTAKAGGIIADAEFVQFHPTALDIGQHPAPLASEALRGEGALLVNNEGHRFMLESHLAAELAPRDIVAREVANAKKNGGAFLDATNITSVDLESHFPITCKACASAGLDLKKDLIPITPAAHYHMGGVACDEFGRSSLDGLYVCGESAANGMHGANRLAGNSLGEALVFASLLAKNINPKLRKVSKIKLEQKTGEKSTKSSLNEIMNNLVGTLRVETELVKALEGIYELEEKNRGSVFYENMLIAAKIITKSALERRESRGAHFRSDYPEPDANLATRNHIKLDDIDC